MGLPHPSAGAHEVESFPREQLQAPKSISSKRTLVTHDGFKFAAKKKGDATKLI